VNRKREKIRNFTTLWGLSTPIARTHRVVGERGVRLSEEIAALGTARKPSRGRRKRKKVGERSFGCMGL